MLRNYCQQARRTAELAELLATARGSTREADDRPLPQQNALHRSVVRLIIDDYEAGASTYELAKRYNVRRNTVRDTLRRAGFDLTAKSKRAALSEEQKAEARRLFASGATRRELIDSVGLIGHRLSAAVSTIWHRRRVECRRDLTPPSRGPQLGANAPGPVSRWVSDGQLF